MGPRPQGAPAGPPGAVAAPQGPRFAHPDAAAIATALIQRFEDCCLVPTPDVGNRWQIGWGMNFLLDGSPVGPLTATIDPATASAWLAARLAGEYARGVDALVADGPDLTAGQRGALYSFAWNEGEANLRASTLLRLILAAKLDSASDQFESWTYGGGKVLRGLVVRRALEQAVFRGLIGLADIPTWELPT